MTELYSCPPCRWRDELMTARARADALEAALKELDGQYSRVLHEMAGAVSLCWAPKPAGVFEGTQAAEFVAAAIAELRAIAARALLEKPHD